MSDFAKSPVGASLLAIAVDQFTSMLNCAADLKKQPVIEDYRLFFCSVTSDRNGREAGRSSSPVVARNTPVPGDSR